MLELDIPTCTRSLESWNILECQDMAFSHGMARSRACEISIDNGSHVQSIKSQPGRARDEWGTWHVHAASVSVSKASQGRWCWAASSEWELLLAWRRQPDGRPPRIFLRGPSSAGCPCNAWAVEAVTQNGWGNQKDSEKRKKNGIWARIEDKRVGKHCGQFRKG